MNLWYSDLFAPGASLSLQVKRTLFSGQSPYQRIDVLDTTEFGLVLLCDGKVRLTERDAFALHEMLVHPALFTHPAPKRVLVIGGGDGGAIGEVVKHGGVEEAVLCEIDGMIVEKALEFFPACAGAIGGSDSRVRLHVDDGLDFIRDHRHAFDVILLDAAAPFGPQAGRLSGEFYPLLHEAMTADGLLVTQGGPPWFEAPMLQQRCRELRAVFPIVAPYHSWVPSRPGGLWSFICAGKTYHPVTDFDRERARRRPFPTHYYHEELHPAAFQLPAFIRDRLSG